MIRTRVLVFLCAAGLIVLTDAHAQITSRNSDRHFVAGARAASLADAYVSEPYDVLVMYTNPAALTSLLRQSVMVNYSLERIQSTDNIMNENVAVPISLRRDIVLGIGATLSHVGHIRSGSPLSGYSFQQYGVEMGIGWSVTPFLSVGAGVNARYGKTDTGNLSTAHASIGAYYSPSPEICYGASLQGLGSGLEYSFDPILLNTVITQKKMERSLQIGLTWRFRGHDEEPIVTIAVANQKIFGVKGLVYKGGVEYVPLSFVMLRVGYWVGDETQAPKFGLGFRLSRVQIDYGVSPSELEPVFHQMSISYDIGGK